MTFDFICSAKSATNMPAFLWLNSPSLPDAGKPATLEQIRDWGCQPIHHYAKEGMLAKVKEELQSDPRCVNIQSEKSGWTPLMFAVGFNDTADVAKLLLKKGAEWHLKDHRGQTALDIVQQQIPYRGDAAYRLLLKRMVRKR